MRMPRSRTASDNAKKRVISPKPGPHVAMGVIDYPPIPGSQVREKGALIYIKASVMPSRRPSAPA
jgi:hypothetical protein